MTVSPLTIPPFGQGKVLVVGDLMLDKYWYGDTSRVSPEAPVPVVKVGKTELRPGGAANVALNIASLGGQVSLCGVTGSDEAADSLHNAVSSVGVHCCFHQSSLVPTITKLRVISRNQQLIRCDFEQALDVRATEGFVSSVIPHIDGVQVMILSDYAKGTLSDVPVLIAQARQKGVKVLVDPKGSDFEKYTGATLLSPNLLEFETVVGHCKSENELIEKGQALREKLKLDALLITRGEQGMTLLQADKTELHLPAMAREVYDVTGAGDTVIGTLAAALAAGASLESATALSNIAASIVVGKLGTATVSAPELARKLHQNKATGSGVMSEEQLMICVDESKARGEKVVFTNGCFDILHAGHVAYLEEARALGDKLVVAVNTDDSVRRLKGDGRPVNTLGRRMRVLSALSAVDWVVGFDEDTPEQIIEKLSPHVLVKGGDYTIDTIVGAKHVQGCGGEVKVLQFVDDVSTTAILNQLIPD